MRITQIFLILIFLFISNAYSYAENLLSIKNIVQRPFSLSASHISTWEKDGIRIFVASNDAKILQGPFQITANTIVCWFHEEEAMQHTEATVEVYCEGNVTILQDENYEKYEQVYLRFETMTGVVVNPDIQPIETLEEAKETEVVLRGEEIRSLGKDEYLSTEIPQKIAAPQASSKEEIVDVIADNIDSWEEGDKRIVVATGNVKIKKGDMALDADNVILWFDKKESDNSKDSEMPLSEIYAEGNVMMRRKNDVQIADKVFEDVKEDTGISINSQIKTTIEQKAKTSHTVGETSRIQKKVPLFQEIPIYLTGEEIEHIGKGQYEIKNGTMSICGYGHPHYHFKGKKVRLVQRGEHNILSSTHNSFYIDKYPVAYFPFLSLDIQKKESLLKDWEFGSSGIFGSFLKTDWDLYAATGGNQKKWSNLTLNLDYLQARGLGTGLDFDYHTKGQNTFGYVDTYYIKDQGKFDINNIPVTNEDRGTILWRHRQELPYDWRMDMEYSYLSDPMFLREYFEQKFKAEKDRETVLYLRKIHDTTAETFSINEQLNGFDTTVDSLREKKYAERLPEASYRILGEPILDNRLIFTSESAVTYFNGAINGTSTIDSTVQTVKPQSLARVDSVDRISMPFKPWVFNINPFVEGRATGYTESINTSGTIDETNGPATGRFIGSMGLDWSSTHSKTYSVYNDFLKINRLRHVFVPELRYIYSPVVTENPNELFQHDPIDALNSSQVAVIGVKNKLQTKRGEPGYEKSIDFIDFNVDYYLFPTSAGIFNDGINGIIIRKDNFVNLDFRSQLTDVVTFVSERNEFNTEKLQFDVFSSGVEIFNPPDWEYFAGYRFITDSSSMIILGANYKISEKWSILAGENYVLKSVTIVNGQRIESNAGNLGTNFVLSRYFHDWVGNISLKLDPVRNDNTYSFDVAPKGTQRPTRRFWF